MTTLVIRHPVSDFTNWLTAYKSADPLRARHGCTYERAYRDAVDPDTVMAVHEFPSHEAVQAFINDPELRAAMEKAGVSGPPRVEIYEVAS